MFPPCVLGETVGGRGSPVKLTAVLGLRVGESAINSNFLYFSDPRAGAATAALPEWFGGGIPWAFELAAGQLAVLPSGLQRHALQNADPDEPRV